VFSTEFSQLTVTLNQPFTDQKPGTSGLRKSTLKFEEPNYLESFIESIFNSLPGVQGGILVVGGDGRYGNKRAIDIILRMAAAHGIQKVITTVDGILSTPAASNLIRINKAIGGIILSASHNPGGIKGDFGVKLNGSNGGPASESLTDEIYHYSKNLKEYKIVKCQSNNSYSAGKYKLASMDVEIIDGIEDYLDLMRKIFDFDLISSYINSDFPIVFDAMSAVTGPYAKRLFVEHLGATSETVMNGIPLEDFGGLHPDPNLTYAKDLADLLLKGNTFTFGAACDGDGDRNMILGRGCFVNPSDSLAILTANYDCVPGYSTGLSGVARSMPTSSAVDVVAKHLGINCFETPTGWKFFGNLLDANQITLCGEESFGTGSNHVREKDGLWAVLFWLQILATKKKSVSEIMKNHWLTFGRHYYSRHDYESIPSEVANSLYSRLGNMIATLKDQSFAGRRIQNADDFSYTDPIDGSITLNQGLRILLDDGSRVLVRLSGTGTQGATLRVYFEKFVASSSDITQDPQLALDPLIKGIDSLAEISKRTGMSIPSVIT